MEVKFQDSLRTQGKVSDRDIRHMMQLHQDQMNEYESKSISRGAKCNTRPMNKV